MFEMGDHRERDRGGAHGAAGPGPARGVGRGARSRIHRAAARPAGPRGRAPQATRGDPPAAVAPTGWIS